MKNRGITLIALVISIIVLLILAGISISMLSGDNGILQKTTSAKKSTENSQIQEQINLAYHSALVDGRGEVTESSLENELKKEFGKVELDEGWLDKESEAEKWRITIDGISLDVPKGIEINEKNITVHNLGLQGGTYSFVIYREDYEYPYDDSPAVRRCMDAMEQVWDSGLRLFADTELSIPVIVPNFDTETGFHEVLVDFDNFPTDLYVSID